MANFACSALKPVDTNITAGFSVNHLGNERQLCTKDRFSNIYEDPVRLIFKLAN